MKKRNVLIVINLFVSAESFLGDQLKYLNDIGYNIHLICSPHENLSKFAIKQGIHFAPLKLARQFSFIDDIKAYFFLCRYIKKNNIDTVIAHQAKSRLLGILASVSMNVPNRIIYAHGAIFETMTGIKQKIMIQMDKFISSLSHKVVCVSSSVANVRLKLGIDNVKKQYFLGNGTCGGIDTKTKFNPNNINDTLLNALLDKYNIKNDTFIVGFCGRLVRDKGIIELVDAFHLLINDNPNKNIKLLIIGPKEIRDSIPEETIEILNNNANIIFTGYIPYDNIQYYYRLMDVLVLPSYREGFPTVVLEASSMEIPIIVSRSTGCIDSIIQDYTGLYTDIDSNDIKNKITCLFNDLYRMQLSINARNWCVEKFDHSVVWPYIPKIIEGLQ